MNLSCACVGRVAPQIGPLVGYHGSVLTIRVLCKSREQKPKFKSFWCSGRKSLNSQQGLRFDTWHLDLFRSMREKERY